ncbi:MAG: cysteine desulfurase [Acidobacteria bacterium]|nr:cysteine desulfurase [Acidobacteriota bacterium]
MDEHKRPIYLDYNATTPHDPEVIEAMRPYLEAHFGNPSSSHWYGRKTHEAVETARAQVAALLNCEPREIVFTSGGTESNNYAIRGIALARRRPGAHIITSQIEHPAVTAVCGRLQGEGFDVTCLPVDEHGLVSACDVERAIRPETILITLMHANNEVGTIQPVEEAARLAKSRGIVFHTDAAQSAGKIPTDVRGLGADLLSIAGHKLYAPKGVGALCVREGLALERLMDGAGQEGGRRPGTENVLEIVGLGKACQLALQRLAANGEHMQRMRQRLETGLRERVPRIRVNGHPERRLPNTLSVSVHGVDANALLAAMEGQVAASAGAACHSGQVHMSHVLRAMQVPEEWARGTLRFSTGAMTSEAEIDTALTVIAGTAARLRREGA